MKKILIFCLFTMSLVAVAKIYDNIRNVELVSVYDGDTIKVNIEGYPDIVGENMSIRLRGIDAPEIRGGTVETKAAARESRDALSALLQGKEIVLKDVERGKYFRIVATIYADSLNVNQWMVDNNYAEVYEE